jgi:LemA protein
MGVWILLAVPVLAAGVAYRRLLTLRDRAQGAWSELEAQLDERHEQIRNLLEAVGETAAGGSEAASALAAAIQHARDAPGIPARAEAENALSESLRCFLSHVENRDRPDQPRIRALHEELIVMEERTLLSAQSYNQHVMAWNQALHRLPWSLVVTVTRFAPVEYFVLDDPDPNAGHSPRL